MQVSIEISPLYAQELLKDSKLSPILVDVRTQDEVQICKIPKSLHIPLDRLPDQVNALSKDKTIIIYCHHGRRSLQATQFLKSQGFSQVFSIHGGIQAWSEQVDPSISKY